MYMTYELLVNAGIAALSSGALAVSFYLKTVKPESWDWKKFGRQVGLAVLVSAAAVLGGVEESAIIASPLYALGGLVIDNIIKIIERRVIPKLTSS